MICTNCHTKNQKNAKFCSTCGNSLKSTALIMPLPGVIDLFKNTLALYQKANPNILFISLIIVAAWTVWKLLVVPPILAVFGIGAFAAIDDLSTSIDFGLMSLIVLAVLILTWVVVFEIGFWGSVAGIVALDAAEKGQTLKLGEIYSRAKRLLLPLSIVSLLVFLVVGLGLVFLIIPGLILGYLLSFVNFVVVVEGATGFSALKRSANLIWKNFWGILGRDILILLAAGLVNLIFGKMFLFNLVSQVVILPFVLTYHYIIFKNIVSK